MKPINQKQMMNNKHSTYENRKHTFWDLGASFLKTGRYAIPQIVNTLYSVPRIIVLKFPKDRSTITNVIARKTLVSTKWMTTDS
jgi:hypothetical protein